ncbi:MAG: CrcB family protein [Rubripirellula sp.]
MTTWINLIAIAGGGALGSVSRYLITLVAIAIPGGSSMLGTTIANVIGCAALGGLIEYSAGEAILDERLRLALQVGFLGSLTTFSTFQSESASLAMDQRWLLAGLYLAANMLLGWTVLIGAAAVVKGWNA